VQGDEVAQHQRAEHRRQHEQLVPDAHLLA
jgi:hypothetical protein